MRVEVGKSVTEGSPVRSPTGVWVAVSSLYGVHTDPDHIVVDDTGQVRQQFALCFHAILVTGSPRPNMRETIETTWIPVDALDSLPVRPSLRLRIGHALSEPDQVHVI